MKFTISFKTPDAVDYAIDRIIDSKFYEEEMDLEDDERWEKSEEMREDLKSFLGKWVKWGEVVTIEFDTDEGTAKVVPV